MQTIWFVYFRRWYGVLLGVYVQLLYVQGPLILD